MNNSLIRYRSNAVYIAIFIGNVLLALIRPYRINGERRASTMMTFASENRDY